MVSMPTSAEGKVPKVLFTENVVVSSKAYASVPKGCRMARPDEVALAYRDDPFFKKVLDALPDAVWTDRRGLDSSGAHRIDDDGRFVKVSDSEYAKLKPNEKSWHSKGSGLVAIFGCNEEWGRWLLVFGDARTAFRARVAYVALG